MLKLIKWELIKLAHQKKTCIAVVILAALALFLAYAFSEFTMVEGVEMEADFDTTAIHPLLFPVLFLGGIIGLFIPLFAVLAVAEMFAGEYSAGTLKTLLVRPLGRTRIVATKLVAGYLNLLLLLFTASVFALLAGYLFFDTASPLALQTVTGQLEFASAGSVLLWSTGFIFLTSVPLMAFVVLISFFATLFNSTAGVIMAALGYLVGLVILGQVGLEQVRYFLQAEHFMIADRLLSSSVPLAN